MHIEQADLCCGLGLVTSVGVGSVTTATKQLQKLIDHAAAENEDDEDHYGSLVVSLAKFQWKMYEPLVLNAGFTIAMEFLNPKTRNICRLYTKILHEAPPPPVEKQVRKLR